MKEGQQMKFKYYKLPKDFNKNHVIIIADSSKLKAEREATALFEMYSHYANKINEFNCFNKIVGNTTGFQSNENIPHNIRVNRETFDKIYEGAITLKLNIEMTYNEDVDLWFLIVNYKGHEICFTNNDN
jgi:hypothetical protein